MPLTTTMRWIDAAHEAGEPPFALVVEAAGSARRRALLRALVARALGVGEAEVAIEHRQGRAPHLVRPALPVVLSSSSRAGVAALALADGPVGVDVEAVGAADLPWLVLHVAEAAALRTLPDTARASAFARLWSLKEAYLKALGTGLAREPSSFAVHLTGEGTATIEDPDAPAMQVETSTVWRGAGERRVAVSAVLLHPCPPLM